MSRTALAGVQERRDTSRVDSMRECKYIRLYPTAAVLLGDWVEIDYAVSTVAQGAHCKQASANSTSVCGVAAQAALAASTTDPILIQVQGPYSTDGGATAALANVATAVTVGQPLNVLGTAGRAQLYVVGTPTGVRCGSAMANASSNTAPVDICNPQNL